MVQLTFLIDEPSRKQFKLWCYERDLTPTTALTNFIRQQIGMVSEDEPKIDGRSTRIQSAWSIRNSGVKWEDSF